MGHQNILLWWVPKYTGMTGSYERPGEKFRRICMASGSPVPVPPLSHYCCRSENVSLLSSLIPARRVRLLMKKTIVKLHTSVFFNLKFNELHNHNLFFSSYLLVNIGLLSLTSDIMTNSSEVTMNVPSLALMRKVILLVFSWSNFPMTVMFPDEASIENPAAYSLGSK